MRRRTANQLTTFPKVPLCVFTGVLPSTASISLQSTDHYTVVEAVRGEVCLCGCCCRENVRPNKSANPARFRARRRVRRSNSGGRRPHSLDTYLCASRCCPGCRDTFVLRAAVKRGLCRPGFTSEGRPTQLFPYLRGCPLEHTGTAPRRRLPGSSLCIRACRCSKLSTAAPFQYKRATCSLALRHIRFTAVTRILFLQVMLSRALKFIGVQQPRGRPPKGTPKGAREHE